MTTLGTKRAGHQFVGVGVGAIVLNAQGQVFLAKRGQKASNDQGLWAWPGGEVEFGEMLTTAIQRELLEEFDMVIEPICQIAAFDHLLEGGQEHWVSVAFIALHISGEPYIKEPGKCSDFGWFSLDALPAALTTLSEEHVQAYRSMFGVGMVRNMSNASCETYLEEVRSACLTDTMQRTSLLVRPSMINGLSARAEAVGFS